MRTGRGAGGLLLLVAVAGMVAVAAWIRPPISGSPAAEPVPAPPAVGDCLLVDPADAVGPPTGPCTQRHLGEVVAVQPRAAVGPELSVCSTPGAVTYLGLQPDGTLDGTWSPATFVADRQIGPSRRQRAAGQQWTACVLVPALPAADTTYTGTARGAFAGGRLPQVYAVCAGTVLGERPMPCGRAHTVEVIGSTWVTGPVDRARLARGCADLVRRVTGLADPTAAGALTLSSEVVGWSSDGMTGDPADESVRARSTGTALCAVHASRELRATLVGIGDRPLPWER
ncbi:hypothetical protein [Nakamurella endophytica]|uniref:Septum formation-related domain-containing protein n=1 Tax=Nakamurella endophytica TaxID=1748367 RepID=A0A917T2G2_9ACTN|nr:hypothetical protein [Nakamurella endophytica]GGM08123.1 hypothetical protein GCM10011594_30120 [Nakamurella endophytica]